MIIVKKNDWYEIRAKSGAPHAQGQPSVAEIFIYGDIGESWDGSTIAATQFVRDIAEIDAQQIVVRINSFGGSVSDGLAIYNAIKRHPANVAVEVDGVALSIASLIAMAGDTLNMAENAMMMIHAPWGFAMGNAAELRVQADVLDKFAQAMATCYAAKTGKPIADMLAMLTDGKDHWYTAQEAHDAGLVDGVSAALAIAASFRVDRFRNIPAAAAAFIKPQESTMDPEGNTPANPAPAAGGSPANVVAIETAAAKRESDRIAARNVEIRAAFKPFMQREGVQALFDAVIDNPTVSIETANARLLAKLGETTQPANPPSAGRLEMGADARDKRIEAMVQANLARMGKVKADGANPWRGHRLADMARASLEMGGFNVGNMAPEEYAAKALSRVIFASGASAGQTTSDFPVVLENTMHKLVLMGYTSAGTVWERFCKVGDVSDFRVWNRIVPGLIGNLDSVNEQGEYLAKNIPDGVKNPVQATRKGNIISVTPEVIVNDDTGYIVNTAFGIGQAGARAIDRAVFTLLVSNPTMSDGIALFHASHGNLAGAGAVVSVTTLDAARTAMAIQTAPGTDAEPLDIKPFAALMPVGLQGDFISIIGAEYDPDATNKLQKPNKVRGMVSDIVGTPRLTGTAWYIFGDPNIAPCIEVVFLNGQREPRVVQEENFSTSGMKVKVELPFGVGAIDHRGAYKNPGA